MHTAKALRFAVVTSSPPESPFSDGRESLVASRDRVSHGGLPGAGVSALRDVEPDGLLCLLSPEAGPGRAAGHLRQPAPRTISFGRFPRAHRSPGAPRAQLAQPRLAQS